MIKISDLKTFKNPIVAAVILAAFFFAGIVVAIKVFGPSPKYWVKKSRYVADVAAEKAKTSASIVIIEGKDVLIAAKDLELVASAKKILDLQAKDAASSSTIGSLEEKARILERDAATVIAVNPAIRALLANKDAQISEYKGVVFTLRAEIVELGPPKIIGKDPVTGKDVLEYPEGSITGNLFAEIVATRVQREEWKEIAGRKDALLATANGLIDDNEKRLASSKFWTWTGWTVAGIFGGIEIYHGIRRK